MAIASITTRSGPRVVSISGPCPPYLNNATESGPSLKLLACNKRPNQLRTCNRMPTDVCIGSILSKKACLIRIFSTETILLIELSSLLRLPPIEPVSERYRTDGQRTHATDMYILSGGGPSSRNAIVLRF